MILLGFLDGNVEFPSYLYLWKIGSVIKKYGTERGKVKRKIELEFITEVTYDCVANLKNKDREDFISKPCGIDYEELILKIQEMQKMLFEDGDSNTVYEYMNARLRANSVICINFFRQALIYQYELVNSLYYIEWSI